MGRSGPGCPSREVTHDVGGWYFEWGGYVRRGQEGWLQPAVFVFVAAIVAAEKERIEAAQRRVALGVLQGWRRAAWGVVAAWLGTRGRGG